MQARLLLAASAALTLGLWPGHSAVAASSSSPAPILDQGEATWYGSRHAGHLTTSGERFDPTQMTAAHASLPLGTRVRVTDMQTGRSVVVRVNDREPPHGVRCIDLSEGAALALGMHNRGVAQVTVSAVEGDPSGQPLEVAEAPDHARGPVLSARHGRRHRRHAAR